MRLKTITSGVLLSIIALTSASASADSLLSLYKKDRDARYEQKQIHSLADLLSFQDQSNAIKKKEMESIATQARLESLHSYAYNIAIKAAMAHQIKNIQETIAANERHLDAIYNFDYLMIKGRVVPPVITEARDLYNQNSNIQIRLSGALYDIYEQARFSSIAPNWREYLQFPNAGDAYDHVVFGSIGLEPKTDDEKRIWVKASEDGWKQGITQANNILQTAMDNLNRDYTGMIRFHAFVNQAKITMPVINSYNLYDTNAGERLILDERLLQIEALPQFLSAPPTVANTHSLPLASSVAGKQVLDHVTPVRDFVPVTIEDAGDALNENNGAIEKTRAVSKAVKGEPLIEEPWDVQLEKQALTQDFYYNQNPYVETTYTLVEDPSVKLVRKPMVQGLSKDDLESRKATTQTNLKEVIELNNNDLPKKDFELAPVEKDLIHEIKSAPHLISNELHH